MVDDEEMMKTAESVRDFGVLTPAIVRPDPDGGYEIVSGHRRHRASELAGKETMPAIVRDLDDDAAIILMVDANLQRETILPSERALGQLRRVQGLHLLDKVVEILLQFIQAPFRRSETRCLRGSFHICWLRTL